jgi:hypothetical protein
MSTKTVPAFTRRVRDAAPYKGRTLNMGTVPAFTLRVKDAAPYDKPLSVIEYQPLRAVFVFILFAILFA